MTARRKHIPQRTCAGCRSVLEKRSLIRIVRTSDGIEIDLTGKKAGRGVYLHRDPVCWQKGIDNAVARGLKIQLSDKDRALLENYLSELKNRYFVSPF